MANLSQLLCTRWNSNTKYRKIHFKKYWNFTWYPDEKTPQGSIFAKPLVESPRNLWQLLTHSKSCQQENDKNKNLKLYPIHEASWWNVGSASSTSTSYCSPKFCCIFKLRQTVECFDVVRNKFAYFWSQLQKWLSRFVN